MIHHKVSQGEAGTVYIQRANGDPNEWLNLSGEKWHLVPEENDDRFPFEAAFCITEVTWVLQTMAYKNAGGGPDGIPMQILPHLTKAGIQELSRITNLSWTNGTCPNAWKESRLIPEPTSKPGAFRPIRLTNAFARVMDRLVTRRLTHFMEQFDRIPGQQAGFRRAMSAEMHVCAFFVSVFFFFFFFRSLPWHIFCQLCLFLELLSIFSSSSCPMKWNDMLQAILMQLWWTSENSSTPQQFGRY